MPHLRPLIDSDDEPEVESVAVVAAVAEEEHSSPKKGSKSVH